MSKKDMSNELRDVFRRLLIKINRFLKGEKIDAEEIAKELSFLLKNSSLGEFLIKHKEIGLTFFREIYKYIPAHIDRIDLSLKELIARSEIPISLISTIYNLIKSGKIKITSVVFLPALTIASIKRGILRLLQKSNFNRRSELLSNGESNLLKHTLRKLSYLDLISETPLSKDLIDSISSSGNVGFKPEFYLLSDREFKLRVVAILKKKLLLGAEFNGR